MDFKSTKGKSPKADVLKQVESDLDSAIAGLPDEPYTTGYAVKGTAQGYKLHALMLEEKWADAAAIAKEIINGGKFSLNSNYAANIINPIKIPVPKLCCL